MNFGQRCEDPARLRVEISPRHVLFVPARLATTPAQVSDFLDITPRLGQDLTDEFVDLRNAEWKFLQVSGKRSESVYAGHIRSEGSHGKLPPSYVTARRSFLLANRGHDRFAPPERLQAVFEAGNSLFYNLKTAPDVNDFPISNSSGLAALLFGEYNTTLEEAIDEGRLYRNRPLPGLGDLPGHNLGHNEEYVTLDSQLLLYR